MDLNQKRPPSCVKSNVYAHLSKPTSLLIQRAFCVNSVLTLDGPAFVAGWEAGCPEDTKRFQEVRNYYSKGLSKPAQYELDEMSQRKRDIVLESLNCYNVELEGREEKTGAPVQKRKEPKP